ncbi:MAG: dienelactone hydrolase family protein [Anaerolineae bacterium]|nr:dienelactone hydrolase family protein [Anaerolineae bacterium]
MRLFEILIAVLSGITLIWALRTPGPASRRWRLGLTWASLILAAAHLWIEGYRWQMAPLYLLVAGLSVCVIRQMDSGLSKGWWGAGVAALVAGVALAVLLPVPRIPFLAGPYAIGTVTYHWIDAARPETYGDSPSGYRELAVQVWYPAAASSGGIPERWLEHPALSRTMATWSHMPGFLLDQTRLTRTHAYPDLPLSKAEARFPVVVYVHGWGGFRDINQDQLETLASHGYVVVSADHVYGALVSVYPDGRVVYNNPDVLPYGVADEVFDQASARLVKTYAADAAFVLDQLALLDAQDPEQRFTGRLDLDRLGIFGHSTGGGAVVQLCGGEQATVPCKAVLGMDAWVEPVAETIIAQGLAQPVLLMNSAGWRHGENAECQARLLAASTGSVRRLTIMKAQHYDFVMAPALSPLGPILGVRGTIPASRVMEINQVYLLAFFDVYLKGQTNPLIDGPSLAYPEVVFE